MIEKLIDKLTKKHLFIIGGTDVTRKRLIDDIIKGSNFEFFRFPKQMRTIDEYVDFVRKENLYEPWYSKKGKFGANQVLDFHRDWISENNSLIVMEEFQEMEQRWKMDLLKSYIDPIKNRKKGEKTIRLIISQENEDGLISNLSADIYGNEKDQRTPEQIVKGSIELVEIKYKTKTQQFVYWLCWPQEAKATNKRRRHELKMKSIFTILLTMVSLSICAQENPFDKLKYDKVIAYEFNGNGMRTIDQVLFGDRERLENQTTLDSSKIKKFEKIISKKNAYGQSTAACFDPHFAVIYYLGDSIVAQVDVCLMCNYLISSKKIASEYQYMMDVGTEFERPLKGFSKSTRKELDEFIASLNFNKYREPLESMFDE